MFTGTGYITPIENYPSDIQVILTTLCLCVSQKMYQEEGEQYHRGFFYYKNPVN